MKTHYEKCIYLRIQNYEKEHMGPEAESDMCQPLHKASVMHSVGLVPGTRENSAVGDGG